MGASLRLLDVAGCNITPHGAQALAEAFASGCCSQLQELCLSGNNIGPEGGAAVFHSLEYVPLLQHLLMANVSFDTTSVHILTDVLARGNMPELTFLDVSGNNVQVSPICSVLAKQLSRLNLSNNIIGSMGGERHLGPRLAVLTKLEHLNISSSFVGNRGVGAIIQGAPTTIKTLDLSDNNVSEDGVHLIVARLRDSGFPVLRVFNLNGNYCAARAAVCLAECLVSGALPMVEELHLAGNAIGNDGVSALADAFQLGWGRHLRILDVSSNSFNSVGASRLAQSLKTACPLLKELKLQLNCVDDSGATALAESLNARSSLSLRRLDVSDNILGDDGLCDLADALSQTQYAQLDTLNISHNRLGLHAFTKFVSRFQDRSCPRNLDVSHTVYADMETIRTVASRLRGKNCRVTL